jgi:type III secretory pathway component EscS
MAGLNQTIMLSLSMVVIAALVGADGLGVPVVRALNQVNTGLGFEAGLVIVVVAIMLDRMLHTGCAAMNIAGPSTPSRSSSATSQGDGAAADGCRPVRAEIQAETGQVLGVHDCVSTWPRARSSC